MLFFVVILYFRICFKFGLDYFKMYKKIVLGSIFLCLISIFLFYIGLSKLMFFKNLI